MRGTLAAPVAAESDRKQQNNAVDAWLAIDACAVDVRRKAAVETTDARALVALWGGDRLARIRWRMYVAIEVACT